MTMNYTALAAELTAGHPDQGAYSATNSIAAEQLNGTGAYTTWLRPADATAGELFDYLAENRSKLASESHALDPTPLLSRLKEVSETAISASTSWGETVTKQQKLYASLWISVVTQERGARIDLVSTELDPDAYTAMGPPASGGAGVWKDPDTTAIKNLSAGQQSRAQEIAAVIDYNGEITESHVAHARSL